MCKLSPPPDASVWANLQLTFKVTSQGQYLFSHQMWSLVLLAWLYHIWKLQSVSDVFIQSSAYAQWTLFNAKRSGQQQPRSSSGCSAITSRASAIDPGKKGTHLWSCEADLCWLTTTANPPAQLVSRIWYANQVRIQEISHESSWKLLYEHGTFHIYSRSFLLSMKPRTCLQVHGCQLINSVEIFSFLYGRFIAPLFLRMSSFWWIYWRSSPYFPLLAFEHSLFQGKSVFQQSGLAAGMLLSGEQIGGWVIAIWRGSIERKCMPLTCPNATSVVRSSTFFQLKSPDFRIFSKFHV